MSATNRITKAFGERVAMNTPIQEMCIRDRDKTAVRQFLPTGLLGALLGTGLAMLADENLLRRGFAVFLLLIGLRQLFPGKPKKKKTGPEA